MIWPDVERLPIVDRMPNAVGKAMYRDVVRKLADLSDASVKIHFDKDAQKKFYEFQNDLAEKIESEPNLGKKSHLSKYEGGLAKIAALLQLVDLVATLPATAMLAKVDLLDGATEDKQVAHPITEVLVDVEHFERALALLAYLESHMHRVYDSKLEGLEYRKVRLLEHIKDSSFRDGFSARDIHLNDWAGLSRKVTTADAIEAALQELAQQGWVRQIPVKPGSMGRPTVRWQVNPAARGMGKGE